MVKQFFRIAFSGLLTLVLATCAVFAQENAAFKVDSVGYVRDLKCTVQQVATIYTLTPVDNPNQRYAAGNMSATYQKDGAVVIVSGVVGKVPPNVRMVGTPFLIRDIRFADKGVTGGVKPAKETGTGGVKPTKGTGTGGVKPDKSGQMGDNKVPSVPVDIKYTQDVVKQEGVVRKMQGQYLIEAGSVRFLPANLKKGFQVEGLKVRFSGKAGEIPANVRLLGTPLKLDKIQKIKGKKKK